MFTISRTITQTTTKHYVAGRGAQVTETAAIIVTMTTGHGKDRQIKAAFDRNALRRNQLDQLGRAMERNLLMHIARSVNPRSYASATYSQTDQQPATLDVKWRIPTPNHSDTFLEFTTIHAAAGEIEDALRAAAEEVVAAAKAQAGTYPTPDDAEKEFSRQMSGISEYFAYIPLPE